MERFVIDENIKDQFELYKNICDYLSEEYDSEFGLPAELERIEKWEMENGVELPHQYKSWLLLSTNANLLDGCIIFNWPKIGSLEDNDVVLFGYRADIGEEFGIRKESGTVYSICDGEETEYDDFDDFLDNLEYAMSDIAEESFGEDWATEFNEKYGY